MLRLQMRSKVTSFAYLYLCCLHLICIYMSGVQGHKLDGPQMAGAAAFADTCLHKQLMAAATPVDLNCPQTLIFRV